MGRFETWMATNALSRQATHSLFIAARREAMRALNKVKQIHLCFKFVSFDKKIPRTSSVLTGFKGYLY